MSDKTSLGDRMKGFYEDRFRFELMRRTYTLIRIDGKAFHTFTKAFKRPFDNNLMSYMDETAKYLCEKIMGAKFAYVQSDEITIVITDFETHQTQAWFEYNLQKMCSIAASMATTAFNKARIKDIIEQDMASGCNGNDTVEELAGLKFAEFDARVFQVPNRIEAFNAVLWRQQDATRNSIQSVAQSKFSPKEMHGKNTSVLQEMMFQKDGTNWNDFEPYYKRGRVIRKEQVQIDQGPTKEPTFRSKWVVDRNIPIFSQDKEYLYGLIPEEEVYEPEINNAENWKALLDDE